MVEHMTCALPKSESTWLGGVQMKDDDALSLRGEIDRFKRELKEIPDPNCGRIQELKEKIRNNTLLTKQAIRETAERIAARFLGQE